MNALDFVAAASDLGLGNQAFAAALGVNVRRVRAYASGAAPIPRVVALAAWALLMQPPVEALVPEWLTN